MKLDELGRVIATTIVNAGKSFVSAPELVVRPYSVLVLADSTYNGKWTKFIFDNTDVTTWSLEKGYYYGEKVKYNNNFYSAKYDITINTEFNPADWNLLTLTEVEGKWVRVRTQLYNTPLYWNYIDWQSNTFDRFKKPILVVEEADQIDLDILETGDYVKVNNSGIGYFVVLEKIDSENGSWDQNFDIVYSQNGTIQISNSIWNYQTNNLGFDSNTFDQTLFGQAADRELQYILSALKDNIFVGDLKKYWNLTFFKCVRFALSEQKFIDWAFKTSFINVINNAGVS